MAFHYVLVLMGLTASAAGGSTAESLQGEYCRILLIHTRQKETVPVPGPCRRGILSRYWGRALFLHSGRKRQDAASTALPRERLQEMFVPLDDHNDLGSPSISPDGKLIAFDALTTALVPVRETWLVNIDGTNAYKFCDGAAPRWSPDGQTLLITRGDGNDRIIYKLDVKTKKEVEICHGRFADWSPDGKRIVFCRGGEQSDNSSGTHFGAMLMCADADGSNCQTICEGNWPSWSPDGSKIAYFADKRDEPPTAYVYDIKEKESRLLGSGWSRPQWAPDSKSLVCCALRALPDDQCYRRFPTRYFLDGREPVTFLEDRVNPSAPCVSPDGKTVSVPRNT